MQPASESVEHGASYLTLRPEKQHLRATALALQPKPAKVSEMIIQAVTPRGYPTT